MKYLIITYIFFVSLIGVAQKESLRQFDHLKGKDRIDSIQKYAWKLRLTDHPKSKELLQWVIEECKNIDHQTTESKALNQLGVIYLDEENFLESEKYLFEALKLIEESENLKSLGSCYNNLGTLFYNTYQLKKAEDYLFKAEEIYKELENPYNLSKAQMNLGLVNEEYGNWDIAFEYYDNALNNAVLSGDSFLYAEVKFNLGSYYTNVGKDEMAEQAFKESLLQFELKNDSLGIANCYYNWALLLEPNKPRKAIHFYQKSLEISRSIKNEDQEAICYSGIMLSYSNLGNYDSSLHYYLLYRDLEYEVNQKKYHKDLIELETQYEVDKKERQLELEQERSEKMELANEANQRTIWLMGGGILLVVMALVGGVVLYIQRQRISALTIDQQDQEISKMISQQETLAYESQIEGERQERRRIAAELHDRVGGLLATINLHTEDGEQESPVRNLVKMTIEEVRNISHNLSESLQSGELKHALEKLKHAVDTSGKLKFELYYELEQVSLPSGISKEVYKVVQELTTNTLKHANAHQITLQLTKVENNISVIFEDDGTGYDSNNSSSGLGINNIQQRINNLGGKLLVDSRKGRGTSNLIEIPIS